MVRLSNTTLEDSSQPVLPDSTVRPPSQPPSDSHSPMTSSSSPSPVVHPYSFHQQSEEQKMDERLRQEREDELADCVKELLDGATSIRVAQLPDLIQTYEVAHGKTLLSSTAYDQVVQMGSRHADIAMEPHDLLEFLRTATVPTSPDSATDRPATPMRRNSRRTSDRVKSPSDSSDTSDEDLKPDGESDNLTNEFKRAQSEDTHEHRKASVTIMSPTGSDGSRRPFPGGGFVRQGSSNGHRRSLPGPDAHRQATTPQEDSPLSARIAATYGSIAFARPLPHRRGFSRDISGHSADDYMPADLPQAAKFSRSTSLGSVASSRGGPQSPGSPGIDDTSFHAGPKSPPDNFHLDDDSFGTTDEPEVFELHDDRLLSADHRMTKLSTASTTSLQSQYDDMEKLRRQLAEADRKRKEAEKALEVMGLDHDQEMITMQEKLEEANQELVARRKEQGATRNHEVVVKNLESEIDGLRRSLNETRAGYTEAQKRLQQATEHSNQLSAALMTKQAEISTLEMAKTQGEKEITRLQDHIQQQESFYGEQLQRKQEQLEEGHEAITQLRIQKEENRDLREENDMLRLHQALHASASKDGTSVPGGSAGPNIMGRNLGAEFARQISPDGEQEQEDGLEPTMVEQTVTTTRVIRRAGPRHARGRSDVSTVFETPEDMPVETTYIEAGINTDPPEPMPEPESLPLLPPAYTPKDETLIREEILANAHPIRRRGSSASLIGVDDENYHNIIDLTGRRCTVLEDEIASRPIAVDKSVRRKRSQTYSGSSANERGEGIMRYMRSINMGPVVGSLGLGIAVGILASGVCFGGSGRSEMDMFTKVNTIAFAAGGYGEGFFPQAMVRNALDQGAGRFFIPT